MALDLLQNNTLNKQLLQHFLRPEEASHILMHARVNVLSW